MTARTPIWLFQCQRASAKARGIGWEFTFDEWMKVWTDSGHWEQRGRGVDKYVMARRGDVGPYAPGNVSIIPFGNNVSEARKVDVSLPLGVSRNGRNGFAAKVCINGKPTYLGTYRSVEQAHAVVLAARAA